MASALVASALVVGPTTIAVAAVTGRAGFAEARVHGACTLGGTDLLLHTLGCAW